jgi:hypothetical protein
MASSGMLHRAARIRTDVSEELSASETSVLKRTARRNISGGAILHSHRRESLKSYKARFYVDSWSDELVVRQSPTGKNLSKKAKNIVGIMVSSGCYAVWLL